MILRWITICNKNFVWQDSNINQILNDIVTQNNMDAVKGEISDLELSIFEIGVENT